MALIFLAVEILLNAAVDLKLLVVSDSSSTRFVDEDRILSSTSEESQIDSAFVMRRRRDWNGRDRQLGRLDER